MGLFNEKIIKALSNLGNPISVIESQNYGLKNIAFVREGVRILTKYDIILENQKLWV